MYLRNKLLISLIVLLSFACKEGNDPKHDTASVFSSRLLKCTDSIFEENENSGIKYIDFRKPEEYSTGHIYGAINIWRTDITDTTKEYGGIRLSRIGLEKLLSKKGIQSEDTLIVYDNRGSADAARFWWIMKLNNFNTVFILDGGLKCYEEAGGIMAHKPLNFKASRFRFPKSAASPILIEKEELFSKMLSRDKGLHLVDVRTADEYQGTTKKAGALKPGRIPGSIHIDWAEAVDYGHTNRFRTIEELEHIYKKIGASKEDTIIVYCHSGVRSSHTSFVLTELLGYKNVRNYDGSWIEWSFFEQHPIELSTNDLKTE